MRNEIYTTKRAEETHELAAVLGAELSLNTIVTLSGDLGSGKTTFIRGLAEGAAHIAPRQVCSPTFGYLNIYSASKTIYHFDLYRLKSKEEFLAAGFSDFLEAGGICCIEWAELIFPLLPASQIQVTLSHLEEDVRKIEIWRP